MGRVRKIETFMKSYHMGAVAFLIGFMLFCVPAASAEGMLSGKVLFRGEPPAVKRVDVKSDVGPVARSRRSRFSFSAKDPVWPMQWWC